MAYPFENRSLVECRGESSDLELITAIPDILSEHFPWGVDSTKQREVRNIVVQVLDSRLSSDSSTSHDYYIIASTLNIAQILERVHVCLGGLASMNHDVIDNFTKQGLETLATDGKANQIDENRWLIPRYPLEVYGTGKNWVYLYYFPEDADRARAKSPDSESYYYLEWCCKIGSTAKKCPIERIHEQIPEPGKEVVGLLLRDDNHKELEKAIHAILKYWGKDILNHESTELFFTNPNIVREKIYELISPQ